MSKKKYNGQDIKYLLYSLDWISIVARAIKNRPTSWNEHPIREFRNASDEILFSLINELIDRGVIDSLEKEVKDMKKRLKI